MQNLRWFVVGVLGATLLCPRMSVAQEITGTGDPLLAIPGGTVINFDSTTPGTYSSLNYSGVTIGGANDQTGSLMRVASQYAGQYNTRGTQYLDNGQGSGYQTFKFNFSTPVSKFAFLFGASDVNWTLTDFDVAQNAIESAVILPTKASNAGDYFGFQDNGIASATLVSSNPNSRDYVFVDNFTYQQNAVATPEPGSIALLVTGGLSGVAFLRRKRTRK